MEKVVSLTIKIAAIILVALISQWIAILVIKRFSRLSLERGAKKKKQLRPKRPMTPGEITADRMRRESRIHTLAGVARSITVITIWGWTIIGVLAAIGINVGPLLTSAGVAGLAIGFGAKALIQDVISGIFMLLEEQYGVGDWIEVQDMSGTVEDVSLRITTIRDIDGTVWYIRNGLITSVGNSTKGFATARLEIPVGLSNDADYAKKIINDACLQAASMDQIEEFMLGKPLLEGVSSVQVDHMTIRVSVKVVPGQQWHVKREMTAVVLRALQNAGISTPYPNGIGIGTVADRHDRLPESSGGRHSAAE